VSRAWLVLASALLLGLYALGGLAWPLGFVALVPWLLVLDAQRSFVRTLLAAWAFSVAYTAAVFGWFGVAIGDYVQAGPVVGVGVLLLAAPLFQPQIMVAALVRLFTGRHHGRTVRALAGAGAWVAAEWLLPRLLGDTLGHGLAPSRLLRQAAELGGATGLTLLLLLVNEAVAAAFAARAQGLRAIAMPFAAAAAVTAMLAAFGAWTLAASDPSAGPALRIGLVQSNIVDYERLRRERGAASVVREVLDTHYAMSYEAVERRHVDAVLWSETVYPTTFGHPKSDAGAELDREILGIVDAAGVPFVFGTYDLDDAGEYNAAAFVEPGRGLLGFYRKTRVFPLTEHVPAWLDGPALRARLPWAGTWQPGSGARVFPLRVSGGREIPVLPMICLDDTDAGLGIAGARLGAQAILTMSNDAWFTRSPQGAALHLAVASFRSIETRLPQFRVTTNGQSAVIDARGDIVAAARPGERTLVIGEAPVPPARPTLMVRWGDWVGRTAAIALVTLALLALARQLVRPRKADAPAALAWPVRVALLPLPARVAAGALRVIARTALLGLGAAVLFGDGALQVNTLAQVRAFAAGFLAPEAAAWCVLAAFAARATIEGDHLVFTRGDRRLALPLAEVAAVQAWSWPLPTSGIALLLSSGARWPLGLAVADPAAWAHRFGATAPAPSRAWAAYVHAREAMLRASPRRAAMTFVVLPLLLALPAFRLHQHIAYGSGFGEAYTFGVGAWLATFALWWASWAIGVAVCATALRVVLEAAALAATALRPLRANATRRGVERLDLLLLWIGLPALLAVRLLAAS